MRSLILLISLCLCSPVALAREAEQQLDWKSLREQGCLTQGVIVPSDSVTPFDSLRVASTGGQQVTIQILALEDPGVRTRRFSLRGKLRHEEVSGRGYLELWAHFPGGEVSSVHTLSQDGPTRYLEGTSGWREFTLPLNAPPSWGTPNRLVLNVSLPGPGLVWLGPLSLVSHAVGWRATLREHAWWIAAGVAATIVLAFEALLLGLARKGKARAAVTFGLIAAFALGACLLAGGVVAATLRRLDLPLAQAVLAGLLVAGTAGVGLIWARRRYDQGELRKMDAMDAV